MGFHKTSATRNMRTTHAHLERKDNGTVCAVFKLGFKKDASRPCNYARTQENPSPVVTQTKEGDFTYVKNRIIKRVAQKYGVLCRNIISV